MSELTFRAVCSSATDPDALFNVNAATPTGVKKKRVDGGNNGSLAQASFMILLSSGM